ncbi:MAG TPA: amino acid permease [Candidatus Limnocylindrales bacterium]|jgi:amino acid transporter|nr:amino acid permease [Candidatus Limnocylindrales bacterium]
MASVTGAPAGARAAPSLFLRNATGLVKGWSGFDAFVYSFMSVNLVTLGMFYSLAVFGYVGEGSPVGSIILSAIAVTFLAITYAGLVAVMPRAGGDYVWQSRVLDGIPGAVSGAVLGGIGAYLVAAALALGDIGAIVAGVIGAVAGGALGLKRGGIAFVLAATGWWFILAQWAPIYGAILKIEFVQPLAALTGQTALVDFIGTADGTFVVSLVVIVLTSFLVSLGMAGYARIQRMSFYVGLAVLAVMFVLMAVSSQADFQRAFDREAQSLFGVSGAYDATIANAATNDAFTGSAEPFSLGNLSPTLLLIPFMMFWILYPNWGATLYGEVRGAGDFRKVLNGMLGGIWVTAILAVIFVFLAAKTFGWLFFNATNLNFINWFYGYTTTDPTIPIWSYPPLLASFLVDNRVFQIVLVVLFGAWFLGWAGTLFLSSTRMIFAAAFDRVLPEAAARVSDRGVPWVALLLIMIPSVVVSWLYAYQDGFIALTLDATLVIAVMFLGTSFAATILPWWKPDIYRASPVARYRVGPIPLISLAGGITMLFLGWTIFEWFTEGVSEDFPGGLYGIGVGNSQSIVWLGVLYGAAVVVYVAARLYRRAQGVNLDAIHAEIPAE